MCVCVGGGGAVCSQFTAVSAVCVFVCVHLDVKDYKFYSMFKLDTLPD